ncbi:MAG: FAD-linked oxidase C-terminal domain-containing protein [Pseudomonadota bacterium]
MPTPRILEALTAALGPDRVFADAETLALYSSDETPRQVTPAAVLYPASHEHVVALMQIAHAHKIPVVARGAGSGNVGGALPVKNGLVVSFECMNEILEFDPANRLMVVQPGVVTEDIGRLARTRGLFYAPDPGSGAYSRIGGNLAMNAAGPRAVKYGVTRDFVLGLKAVTGDGKTITTGCRTSKGVTGYDFTRLLVGSEGTLALITEATLRLLPAPETVATLRLCFSSNRAACEAVERVMSQAVLPCALEIMDRRSIEAIRPTGAADDLPFGTEALLMVEADGPVRDVPHQIAALKEALKGGGLLEVREGVTREEAVALWSARKSLSHAVKQYAPLKINEDVVVPVSRLADFIDFLDQLAQRYPFPIVSFGHAGNGNLHVNLMVHPDDAEEMAQAHACLKELFSTVLAYGGTLSGEHGIGTEKRAYVGLEIDPDTLNLMRAVKKQFDPAGILNPGKLFPDQ